MLVILSIASRASWRCFSFSSGVSGTTPLTGMFDPVRNCFGSGAD